MRDTIKKAILAKSPFLIKEMVDFGAIKIRPVENPITFRDYRVSVLDIYKYAEFQKFQEEAEKEIARMNYAIKKRDEEQDKMASIQSELPGW